MGGVGRAVTKGLWYVLPTSRWMGRTDGQSMSTQIATYRLRAL